MRNAAQGPELEATVVPPWRPEHGPEPTVTVWPPAHRPLLDIWLAGTWKRCSVLARHDYPDDVVYQVEVPIMRDSWPVTTVQAYRWDPRVMRPGPRRPQPVVRA